MNFDSFSHGQVKSKIWLCDKLEPHVPQNSVALILGSWVNVTGFMMMTRQPKLYKHILGIDIDSEAISLADKINNYGFIEGFMRHEVCDANTVDTSGYNIVINCSSEHMKEMTWFDNIKPGTLVCIQSSNVTDENDPWFITNPSPTYESFIEKYPLTQVSFAGTLPIRYGNWGYDRYMIIGIK